MSDDLPGELVIVTTDIPDESTDAALVRAARELPATLASLHGEGVSLTNVLADLHERGRRHIRVVIAPAPHGGTGASWARRVAAHWWRGLSVSQQAQMRIEVAGQAASSREWQDLHASAAAPMRQITGSEAGLKSPAWEHPPASYQQVLVCRGPRCNAQGGDAVAAALSASLRERGCGDDEVLLTQTGCLFPCNQAPVVRTQPDGQWFGRVNPADSEALIAQLRSVSARPESLTRD